jgi:hypothetical protein
MGCLRNIYWDVVSNRSLLEVVSIELDDAVPFSDDITLLIAGAVASAPDEAAAVPATCDDASAIATTFSSEF